MRLFIAINLPADHKRHLWSAAAPLREAAPGVSWVGEDKVHLTLKFLGERPEDALPELSAALAVVAARHSRPLVRLSSVGGFPNLRRPRVVWVGVEPDPRLELLHHDVEIECQRLGYEVEGRPFRPHLTIGRVRDSRSPGTGALTQVAKKLRFDSEFIVPSIDLMQSTPGSGGSRYRTVVSSALRRE